MNDGWVKTSGAYESLVEWTKDELRDRVVELEEAAAVLRADTERLRAALGFYADGKTWSYARACPCLGEQDAGTRARTALAGEQL